jgi:hypothetical protein
MDIAAQTIKKEGFLALYKGKIKLASSFWIADCNIFCEIRDGITVSWSGWS